MSATAAARVLVVDDEPDLARALQVRLTAEGFDCVTVGSGAEALARVREAAPAVIVADLRMPGMDGFELCRRLQGHAATAAIPVVVLTAQMPALVEPRREELGVRQILYKPCDAQALVAAIRGTIESVAPGGVSHG